MADKKFYYSKGSFDSISSFKSSVIKMTSKEAEGYLNNKDFSNWLSNSLGEKKLAGDISKLNTRKELLDFFRSQKKPAVKPKPKAKVVKPAPAKKALAPKKKSISKPKAKIEIKKPSVKTESTPEDKLKTTQKKEIGVEPAKKKEESLRMPARESKISYISSESPNVFVLKEFLFGALFGLMLGLILMAMLISSGIYY